MLSSVDWVVRLNHLYGGWSSILWPSWRYRYLYGGVNDRTRPYRLDRFLGANVQDLSDGAGKLVDGGRES